MSDAKIFLKMRWCCTRFSIGFYVGDRLSKYKRGASVRSKIVRRMSQIYVVARDELLFCALKTCHLFLLFHPLLGLLVSLLTLLLLLFLLILHGFHFGLVFRGLGLFFGRLLIFFTRQSIFLDKTFFDDVEWKTIF